MSFSVWVGESEFGRIHRNDESVKVDKNLEQQKFLIILLFFFYSISDVLIK